MIVQTVRGIGFNVVAPLALVLLLSGLTCRQEDASVEVVPLVGKVEKIDARPDGTGELVIAYFSERHNQEISGVGQVTKETEIMINGATATLADVRLGEQVRGEVRVEKKGKERKRIALKIYVDRPAPLAAPASNR